MPTLTISTQFYQGKETVSRQFLGSFVLAVTENLVESRVRFSHIGWLGLGKTCNLNRTASAGQADSAQLSTKHSGTRTSWAERSMTAC